MKEKNRKRVWIGVFVLVMILSTLAWALGDDPTAPTIAMPDWIANLPILFIVAILILFSFTMGILSEVLNSGFRLIARFLTILAVLALLYILAAGGWEDVKTAFWKTIDAWAPVVSGGWNVLLEKLSLAEWWAKTDKFPDTGRLGEIVKGISDLVKSLTGGR